MYQVQGEPCAHMQLNGGHLRISRKNGGGNAVIHDSHPRQAPDMWVAGADLQGRRPRLFGLRLEALDDQGVAGSEIEAMLGKAVGHDEITYPMLMMLDLDVQFHVTPRYSDAHTLDDRTFRDGGRPRQPDLATAVDLSKDGAARLATQPCQDWPAS